MAPPPPLELPEEVVTAILRHVNRLPFTRIATLKSCALLSRAFVRPSQAHIFSSINFDISRTSRFVVFQALCVTLLKDRLLGTYVEELQVRSDSPDLYEVHIPAFNAFRTITGLHKFTFICGRQDDNTSGGGAGGIGHGDEHDAVGGWEHFARTVKANLEFIFTRPSLRTLELGGIQNFPSSLLLSFMRLDHLLLDAHFTVEAGAGHASSTPLMVLANIRLQSLALREVNEDLISGLASMLAYKPHGLKKLDLSPVRFVGVEGFSNAVWTLMRLGCRSLEEFEWEGVASRTHAFKPIDLGTIRTTLRHLTVSITYRLWFDEPQVLTDLQALLRQLSGSDAVLEVITIKTSFAGGSSGGEGASGGPSSGFDLTRDPEFLAEWSDLDKILSAKKAFKKLDRIELEYFPSTVKKSDEASNPIARPLSKSASSRLTHPPPSLSEVVYMKELEWWTDTACAFAERLAGTRSKGVVIVFGESKTRRRSWAVFDPRSPLSPAVGAGDDSGFSWRPLRI